MKKVLALALVCGVALVGCGDTKTTTSTKTTTNTPSGTETKTEVKKDGH
jgi:hypothetical protein